MRRTALTAVILAAMLLGAACSADPETELALTGSLNGEALDQATRTSPLDINPEVPVVVEVTIDNPTADDAQVRHLRLEGQVLGMRFAHANTQVDFTVPANDSRTYAAEIDFFDLSEQINGQASARLGAYDDNRELLASDSFFVDVAGDWTSTLAITFFQVLAFAVVSLAANWLGLIRQRLPANRFVRGLRFAATGLAAATALLLLASLVGLWLPPGAVWVPVLIVATLASFALGYVSPGPAYLDEDDEELALLGR